MEIDQVQAGMRVAIVGAGMAGASCARMLSEAGCQVTVFDKSRGVGGRMTTRRVDWTDAAGVTRQASFDHGAPCFEVSDPDFAAFLAVPHAQGQIAPWPPASGAVGLAAAAVQASDVPGSVAHRQWLATPDMPALCRSLLAGLTVHTRQTVQSLQRKAGGWCVTLAEGGSFSGFDAVLLAIPPQQAAALLEPQQPDWAQQAAALTMLPDWTLMAISGAAGTSTATATAVAEAARAVPVALPDSGPLAMIVCNDSKPGRTSLAGLTHWVAHASTAWSQAHLEESAEQVQQQLLRALDDWLGASVRWQYATVHRWRYATLQTACVTEADATARHYWDRATRLGVCGDAWGGGGVQGAWLSARALCTALLDEQ